MAVTPEGVLGEVHTWARPDPIWAWKTIPSSPVTPRRVWRPPKIPQCGRRDRLVNTDVNLYFCNYVLVRSAARFGIMGWGLCYADNIYYLTAE